MLVWGSAIRRVLGAKLWGGVEGNEGEGVRGWKYFL